METERRRDRIWKMILMTVYTKGRVHINDMDVSMTRIVDTREEAEQLVEEEAYRDEENIHETAEGRYEVLIEPDASDTTKRSVLQTLSKDRYGFLEEHPDEPGVWIAGPVFRTIASTIPAPDKSTEDRKNDILSDMQDDPTMDMEDAEYILAQFNSSENVAK